MHSWCPLLPQPCHPFTSWLGSCRGLYQEWLNYMYYCLFYQCYFWSSCISSCLHSIVAFYFVPKKEHIAWYDTHVQWLQHGYATFQKWKRCVHSMDVVRIRNGNFILSPTVHVKRIVWYYLLSICFLYIATQRLWNMLLDVYCILGIGLELLTWTQKQKVQKKNCEWHEPCTCKITLSFITLVECNN